MYRINEIIEEKKAAGEKISLKDMAATINPTAASGYINLRNIIIGKKKGVTREQLEAIAKYLDVDVRELFYPGVKPVEMSEEIKQFLFQLIKEDQLIQTDNEVEDYKRKGTAIDACVVLFGMNSDEVKRIIEM